MDAEELKDIERLREDNRAALGTQIPIKLFELSTVLEGRTDRLEPWYVLLLLQLAMNVTRVCRELCNVEDDESVPTGFGSLPAVAWNVRNLLELWVWMEYCCASQTNARRFHEDALRDAHGLADSFFKISDVVGTGRELEPQMRKGLEVAARAIGLETVDGGYLNVADAAKAVKIDNWYSPCNKMYSKLAHPTALLITRVLQDSDFSLYMPVLLKVQGVVFAQRCVAALEERIRKIPAPAKQTES
jgi:hypothetical protein